MLASSIITMALPSPRSLLLRALVALPSLPAMASALSNYTQADMMQAQLALLDGRSPDCPPWYVPRRRAHFEVATGRFNRFNVPYPCRRIDADGRHPCVASIVYFPRIAAPNTARAMNSTENATAPRASAETIASNHVRSHPDLALRFRGRALDANSRLC